MNNLDWKLVRYDKCKTCRVQRDFHVAEQSVIKDIINHVQALKIKFPSYAVIVTGHSLGAALATLTALDFVSSQITPVRLFTFGSPRIGNAAFANYSSSMILDRYRHTHHRDVVPHVPMRELFTHLSGEWYEDDAGHLHACTGHEDPHCSYQWSETAIDDHMRYLGLQMGCDGEVSSL